MRLDKFLCSVGLGSRKEVKALIKKGQIKVNEKIIKLDDFKINEESDVIKYKDEILKYEAFHYYMLHKPKDFITSTKDKERTVMELIDENFSHLAPVGRLDKDTEGLLLITDDGELAHIMTSPKKHVEKTYYVCLLKPITLKDVEILSKGVKLDDGYVTLPALVEVIDETKIHLTIHEGKYHQVKRMMEAIDNKVIYLKRIKFGPLTLDIECGKYRKLTKEEIEKLNNLK